MRGVPEERLVKLPQAGRKRPRQKAEALPRGELEEPGARRARKGFASGPSRRFELLLPAQRHFLFELWAEVVATEVAGLGSGFRVPGTPWASEKKLAQAAGFVSQWRSELNRNFRGMALEFSPPPTLGAYLSRE